MTKQRRVVGSDHIFASAREFELVDISSTDHEVSINDGIAFAINCDTAGEILKIDTEVMTGYTTLPLVEGINLIQCTKVYKTGSTIAGIVELQAW